MPLQLRRGTEQERQDMTQPLAEGEPLFITDDNALYIGIRNNDGTFPLPGDLVSPTTYTDSNARTAIVNMLEGGIHPDIVYNYTNASNTLDVELNLQSISQSIIPNVNATHDLGSDTNRFRNLYLSGSSLWVGEAHITADGAAVNLPTGSTINGTPIEDAGLIPGGNYSINIVSGANDVVVINSFHNMLRTDDITLVNNIISVDNDVPLQIESRGSGRYIITTRGTATTSSISDFLNITDYSNFNFIAEPPVGTTSFEQSDITSIIQFSASDESTKNYGSAFIGTQIDPGAANNAEYAPSKMFIGTLSDLYPTDHAMRYLTFDSKGQLAVNKENAEATLDINGFMKLAILGAEPANVTNGVIAIADGSSWNPTGSGSQTLVVRLNNAWVAIAS